MYGLKPAPFKMTHYPDFSIIDGKRCFHAGMFPTHSGRLLFRKRWLSICLRERHNSSESVQKKEVPASTALKRTQVRLYVCRTIQDSGEPE